MVRKRLRPIRVPDRLITLLSPEDAPGRGRLLRELHRRPAAPAAGAFVSLHQGKDRYDSFVPDLAVAVLAALLLAALAGPAFAAGPTLEGNWKFKDVSSGRETTLALIKIEVKDGKPAAERPLLAPRPGLRVDQDLKVSDSSVRFTFKLPGGSATVTLSVPKGDEKPKALRGTFQFGKRPTFAELERTDLKETRSEGRPEADPGRPGPHQGLPDPAGGPRAAAQGNVEKNGDTTAGYSAAEMLLGDPGQGGAKDEDLRTTADTMLKVAKPYGPAAEKYAVLSVAQTLTRAAKATPLAVEYARKAEKGLTKDDSAELFRTVLKTLVTALKKNGKADEAKEVAVTLAKLTKELDEEFERTAIPFKVDAVARKGKSSRVALVELFTGAQCPPCVSADIAFDAAVKAYKPADVVLLEYHEHIPGPDPLTNADTEGRHEVLRRAIRGTPTAFVNGKVTDAAGRRQGPRRGELRHPGQGRSTQALETDDAGRL